MPFRKMMLLLATIAAASPMSRANTIYSNLDQGGASLYNQVNLLSNENYLIDFPPYSAIAVSFVPSADFELTQIDVAIQWWPGRLNCPFPCLAAPNGPQAYLDLYADSGGRPDAVSLASWDIGTTIWPAIVTMPTQAGTCCGLDSESFSGIELDAGQQYWIVATPQANTVDVWQPSALVQSGEWLAKHGGSVSPYPHPPIDPRDWTTVNTAVPAFDVLGTPVPEPSPILMLGIGLLCLGWIAKRKSRTLP